jgi:hypothetical protein
MQGRTFSDKIQGFNDESKGNGIFQSLLARLMWAYLLSERGRFRGTKMYREILS